MKKRPDEKTLAGYLDYKLPLKQWQEVKNHRYFYDDCQKIVRIAVEAIRLRRYRLALSENEKKNEFPAQMDKDESIPLLGLSMEMEKWGILRAMPHKSAGRSFVGRQNFGAGKFCLPTSV